MTKQPARLKRETVSLSSTPKVKLTTGGGCREHTFGLAVSRAFLESHPVQVDVLLSHDAKDDPCDAILPFELFYDLSPLKRLYQDVYHAEHGTIVLRLFGTDKTIAYTF